MAYTDFPVDHTPRPSSLKWILSNIFDTLRTIDRLKIQRSKQRLELHEYEQILRSLIEELKDVKVIQ